MYKGRRGGSYARLVVFEVVRKLDSPAVAAVRELVTASVNLHSHPVLDEARFEQAARGETDGLWAAIAWDERHETVRAYAQAVRGAGGWDVEDVASAEVLAHDHDLRRRLVKATLDAVAVDDGGDIRYWVRGATEADDRMAVSLGLYPTREIRQLRCPLPAAPPPEGLTTRPFVVGQDEEAWVNVNSRAFAWHPEQGRVTLADLRAQEAEPWFDPTGFLLHERDGRLAAFCWTKVHADTIPPLGEIYVIAVDPDFHGQGLGRALTLAGLDHLHRSGLTVGMLYVESDNMPALALYETIGFTPHHVDRVYR